MLIRVEIEPHFENREIPDSLVAGLEGAALADAKAAWVKANVSWCVRYEDVTVVPEDEGDE